MVKKGQKKKKQQATVESTSGDTSSEKSQQQASQQQVQEKREISSQALPQISPGPSQQPQKLLLLQQQRRAWGPPLQQQVPSHQQLLGPYLPPQQVVQQQQSAAQGLWQQESQGLRQQVPQGLRQQVPQGLRQQVPHGLRQQEPQGLRQQVPQGLQQQVPQGLQQQVPRGLRQQVPQGLRQQVPQGLRQQVPQGLRQQVSQGLRQQVPQCLQQQVPQGLQQQVPQGLRQQVPQDLRQQVPQGLQQQVPQGLRQQVPQGLQQQVPQGLQQQIPQSLRQEVPQDLRQQVPQRIRQQVPQGLQQQVSQSLQQQIPQGLRQQVPQGLRQQVPHGLRQQEQQGLRQQVPQDLRQQVPQGLRQEVPQGLRQQVPQGLRQQVPQGLRQQVSHGLRQQVSQGLQQQVPQGLRQQVPQGLRQQVPQCQPQQKVAWSVQQQQQAVGSPWQQVPQGQSQQQQQQMAQSQPAWGPPQSQTQSQPAWGPPQSQQQKSQSLFQQQQQQQKASTSLQQQGAQCQQQQKVSIDTGGSGDHRLVQAKNSMHRQQPSTSAQSLDITQLDLTDPFHHDKTDKTDLPKMTPAQKKEYFEQIPKRINPMKAGTVGQRITVWTNMFQIIFDDKFVTNAVHYDVTVKPFKDSRNSREDSQIIKLPKALCRNIFEQCRSTYFKDRFPAYDGNKNAYSANDLPTNDMAAIFSHTNNRGEQKQYQIILKKVSNVDLSWIKNLKPGLAQNREQSAIQVLDIIMRHAPESRFTNIGRSLFWDVPTNENTRETLSNGLTLAHGGYLSGVLGWKPYLNVDVSHKAFTVQKRILEYIVQVAGVPERSLTYDNVMELCNKRRLNDFLKGLKVIYQIPNRSNTKRTHRVYEISTENSLSTFDVREPNGTERTYTMKEYFQVVKGYKIMYPHLPTLRVVANANKTLLPMELCTIVPDQPIRKPNEEQTASMIKQTATDAPTRKKRIEDAFKQINVNNSPVMKQEFRLSVSAQMKQVDARILPPPELKYAARTTNVSKGVWRLQPFKEAKNLENKSWTILDLSGKPRTDPFIHEFVRTLQKTGDEVGMQIGAPDSPFKKLDAKKEREITSFFNANKHLKLIIVIIPNVTDVTDVTYGKVKKITEMEIGVLTQCMKYRTLTRANAATVKNILLKINSKLNGVNHVLQTMPACINKSMLVGADVTHPSPDSKDSPSVAAVAASRDDLAFQYNVELRLQPPKQEIISDLENIIIEQLKIYKSRTGYTPQRLIYYRDGVSEGQLTQIMYYELKAIRDACSKESPNYNIQIICMVVQKRHHIRLFPTDERYSDDRNRNVKAGTIVDTEITHPDHIDFYLVSHASIQGTARPTKYRCLCNDSNFNEDQLEELTYHLCHMYARCTRSVSYPAPTYYAHLAAYRGRALLKGNRDFKLCNLQREQEKFQLKMSESPMFFV